MDGRTGREIWRATTPMAAISAPAVHGGQVTVQGCDDFNVPGVKRAVFDAATGKRLERSVEEFLPCAVLGTLPNQAIDRPVFRAGDLLIHITDISVYALDSESQEVKWLLKVPRDVFSPRFPTVAREDDLIVIARKGRAIALDANKGTVLWERKLRQSRITTVAILEGIVYLGVSGKFVPSQR